MRLWIQVRDLATLNEMWIVDPDGLRIGMIEVPPQHPLRRDPRG